MNRLLFIVFTFIMFSQPVIAQGSIEDNFYIKRMREEYEHRQKQQNNFQKPMDDSVLTMLGRWAWGACGGVDIHLPYAYIGNGSLIQILDVSNPETPAIIGEYMTGGGIIDALVVKDNLLYANSGGYLLILDISNPNQPSLLGSVNAQGWHLAVSDSFAYVTNWGCYLRIVDISNPSNPYLRGSTYFTGDELPTNLTVQGKTVYANGRQMDGFSMIDVADPDQPQSYLYSLEKRVSDLTVYDTLLFVSTMDDSFLVYSVSNRFSPIRIAVMPLTQTGIIEAVVYDNIVYATEKRGLYSIDISNPAMPVERDYYSSNNLTHYYGYVRCDSGMLITDVHSGMMLIEAENPDSLKQISYFATGNENADIKVINNLAFVASGLSGMWILDISNQYEPKEIANVNTGSYARAIDVQDDFAYVICRNDYISNDTARGMYIINCQNINRPNISSRFVGMIKSFNAGVWVPNTIDYIHDKVLITQSINGCDSVLEIIDVSNSTFPFSLGVYEDNILAKNVIANDSIIYLGSNDKGVAIINYINPSSPYLIKRLFPYTWINYLAQNDSMLFILEDDSLYILDNVNGSNPQIVSFLRLSGNRIVVENNFAYITYPFSDTTSANIAILNINNPVNPLLIGYFRNLPCSSMDVKNQIMVLGAAEEIWLVKNNLIIDIPYNISSNPNQFILYQNYPNPFNNNTSIGFFLQKSGYIKLELFNVLGQKVKTIFSGFKNSGYHNLNINFLNYSSGVYIYKLSTSCGSITKKLTYIK